MNRFFTIKTGANPGVRLMTEPFCTTGIPFPFMILLRYNSVWYMDKNLLQRHFPGKAVLHFGIARDSAP